MLPFLTLDDIDLSGKTLIIRVDFNCPVNTQGDQPELKDKKRIDDHIENTICPLFDSLYPPRNIVLLSHQGRKGEADCTTLRPHFEDCRTKLQLKKIKTFYIWEELTDKEVFALGEEAVASPKVLDRIRHLRERTVLLLENVRFSKHEDANGKSPTDFAEAPLIRMLADVDNRVAVLDGFSVAHRAQASVVGLANLGRLYAGPVLVREATQLSTALENPIPPVILVVGGAKITDSMHAIERFLEAGTANLVITGGLVGLMFAHAQGHKLNDTTLTNITKTVHGNNLRDATKIASRILKDFSTQIQIPVDVAVAPKGAALPEVRSTIPLSGAGTIPANYETGDIGIESIARYNYEISKARTIVMNGPMGRYESPCFDLGTREVLRYIALVAHDRGAHALIGGGDTSAALGQLPRDLAEKVSECSSGKAFLEVLASGSVETLAGTRALTRKTH